MIIHYSIAVGFDFSRTALSQFLSSTALASTFQRHASQVDQTVCSAQQLGENVIL